MQTSIVQNASHQPRQPRTLQDVLNHPWMIRGFNGPPDPHLVRREPLRAEELDRNVVHDIKGFSRHRRRDSGSSNQICTFALYTPLPDKSTQ
ncbi:hypothetical protein M378DRAFT_164228 [Amanita muscaria Koide BX008]|uniref:Uncharacterized protein n=1 Tax=Amanita muscaria (strain Koide BX008) TaxID=946122 RepID=A0A0C2X4W2_AMAMK|nr:hypothetical protein M378DRAFT_164228 [Amanita muscaria Koide BX008]